MTVRPLVGQVALVTGAGSGIGAATAVRLARDGAAVAVNVHHSGDGEQTLRAIEEVGSTGTEVTADVSSEDDVARLFERVKDEFGRPSICVSNAGMQIEGPFLSMSFEDWKAQMGVNLDATFLVGRAAAQAMSGHGGGVIINITSVHERTTFPGFAAYCAAKAAASMLTRCMARELAPEGIRVVAVAPGAITSGGNDGVESDPEALARAEAGIPAHRLGRPEEVADLVAYLVSAEAAYITGSTVFIDGAVSEQVSTS